MRLDNRLFIILSNYLPIDGCRGSRKSLINVQKPSFVKPFEKILVQNVKPFVNSSLIYSMHLKSKQFSKLALNYELINCFTVI